MAEREPNAARYTLDGTLDIDANGFMNLQIPEYAYMYGFLQADGHLARGTGHKGRLTVEINARDSASKPLPRPSESGGVRRE